MAKISVGRSEAASVEQRQTKTLRGAEVRGGRRTPPEDHRPYSPEYVERMYAKDKHIAGYNTVGGDGLVPQALHDLEVMGQRPEFNQDGRLSDFQSYNKATGRLSVRYKDTKNNGEEIPIDGSRGWLRGGGKEGAGYRDFDRVGIPQSQSRP